MVNHQEAGRPDGGQPRRTVVAGEARQTLQAVAKDAGGEPPADYGATFREKQGPSSPEAEGTVVERPADPRKTAAAKSEPAPGSAATPFRSLNRPPMALLVALDDGSTDQGETWRVRIPRFVIGRAGGEAVIAHDLDMSAEHAEITRVEEGGGYTWYLTDLKSANGTFLRVERAVLRNGRELLLGGRRYVFRAPGVLAPGAEGRGRDDVPRRTHKQEPPPADAQEQLQPRLVELTADGDGRQYPLRHRENRFGSDAAQCEHAIANDPFLSPRQARLVQDKRGRWVVFDERSTNGLWVRINRVPLDAQSEFQLGGQRFRFSIL